MTLLVPAIHPILTTQRQLLYVDAHECGEINFLGDRKADLPDYNVKYGTYTILDSQKGIVTNFHVSHVWLAGISKIMELNGLKYVLQRLHYNSVEIAFWPPIDTNKFVAVWERTKNISTTSLILK